MYDVTRDFYNDFGQIFLSAKVEYRRREALDRIAEVILVDFKGYLNEKQSYLTSGQIRELIDREFAIGAHSINHSYYSALSWRSNRAKQP